MSMLDSYVYHVDVNWTGKRSGDLLMEDFPTIAFSAPPEFSGDPGRWTPEHLLVAATASCFLSTFMSIAEVQKLNVTGFRMMALARLEKIPGEGYRFTEITLTPEIHIAHDDLEKAQKTVEKAQKNCFISKSLRATVQVEPHFVSTVAALVG